MSGPPRGRTAGPRARLAGAPRGLPPEALAGRSAGRSRRGPGHGPSPCRRRRPRARWPVRVRGTGLATIARLPLVLVAGARAGDGCPGVVGAGGARAPGAAVRAVLVVGALSAVGICLPVSVVSPSPCRARRRDTGCGSRDRGGERAGVGRTAAPAVAAEVVDVGRPGVTRSRERALMAHETITGPCPMGPADSRPASVPARASRGRKRSRRGERVGVIGTRTRGWGRYSGLASALVL